MKTIMLFAAGLVAAGLAAGCSSTKTTTFDPTDPGANTARALGRGRKVFGGYPFELGGGWLAAAGTRWSNPAAAETPAASLALSSTSAKPICRARSG